MHTEEGPAHTHTHKRHTGGDRGRRRVHEREEPWDAIRTRAQRTSWIGRVGSDELDRPTPHQSKREARM